MTIEGANLGIIMIVDDLVAIYDNVMIVTVYYTYRFLLLTMIFLALKRARTHVQLAQKMA